MLLIITANYDEDGKIVVIADDPMGAKVDLTGIASFRIRHTQFRTSLLEPGVQPGHVMPGWLVVVLKKRSRLAASLVASLKLVERLKISTRLEVGSPQVISHQPWDG